MTQRQITEIVFSASAMFGVAVSMLPAGTPTWLRIIFAAVNAGLLRWLAFRDSPEQMAKNGKPQP